jgi:hypothetical protein
MPGLEDLIGKGPQGEQGLTENAEQINPLEATPDGGNGEENPLEKMDEISKAKPDKKDSKGNKKLDAKTLEDMLMTGENTEGMFEPDKKEPKGNEPKLNEEVDEDAKRNLDKGTVKASDKYAKSFKNDLLKHPNEYKVQTPEGEMTIAEAIKRGYNPITKRFEEKHNQANLKESFLSQLNDTDRQNIERITDPSAAQVAPADAEKYGLDQNSPMVRQNPTGMPGQPMEPQAAPPAAIAGGSPIGTALPGSQESIAPGGTPLETMLGGNQ